MNQLKLRIIFFLLVLLSYCSSQGQSGLGILAGYGISGIGLLKTPPSGTTFNSTSSFKIGLIARHHNILFKKKFGNSIEIGFMEKGANTSSNKNFNLKYFYFESGMMFKIYKDLKIEPCIGGAWFPSSKSNNYIYSTYPDLILDTKKIGKKPAEWTGTMSLFYDFSDKISLGFQYSYSFTRFAYFTWVDNTGNKLFQTKGYNNYCIIFLRFYIMK